MGVECPQGVDSGDISLSASRKGEYDVQSELRVMADVGYHTAANGVAGRAVRSL
jgi:hypothetical protein